MTRVDKIKRRLLSLKNPQKAAILQQFFKTGPGEYAEGDKFIGLTVPILRAIAKQYISLSLTEISELLKSEIHEFRFFALAVLVQQVKFAPEHRKQYADFYIKHKMLINNWDLVDVSAEHVLGPLILSGYKPKILRLAGSKGLWDRRIAVMSTFYLIKRNQFEITLNLVDVLMNDKADLIHKACGWMLREIGKRDVSVLLEYLDRLAWKMPRTMLRYAIERLDKKLKKKYLSVKQ